MLKQGRLVAQGNCDTHADQQSCVTSYPRTCAFSFCCSNGGMPCGDDAEASKVGLSINTVRLIGFTESECLVRDNQLIEYTPQPVGDIFGNATSTCSYTD